MQWKHFWSKLNIKQKALFVFSAIGVVGLCLFLLVQPVPENKAQVIAQTTQQQKAEVSQRIYAEATGQVKSPGVYQLTKDMLVLQLIEMAGGFTENADLGFVHKNLKLAVLVKNGEKIYIPSKSENAAETTPGSKLISLNSGSKEELMELPGIGEATADKIIAERPYAELEDLKNVSGIGDSTYNKIITLLVL